MFLSSIVIFPPPRHRVARVDHEVHENLLDLRRVGEHRRQVRPDLGRDLNLRADEPLQHVLHVRHELIERDRLLRDDLTAAERQQLAREPGRAICRLEDLLCIGAPLVSLVEVLHEHLRVAVDGHQQIVEVVRDAAGEPADRLHLLRLPQLLLALPKRVLRLLALR